ncbi:hypothetical protein DERP_003401 [Dermatophagoides pteronyssinus]|uniref:Myb/SANT-like DNA-binding domain-containing protein n=1 Tax=Dermatophagoides pteronyssinus TaxID=6956 RepID=A0ABQ8JJG0_DERPT|nr:hypothetical protein DERP_003401 [Dermatophagoides pteronyssinus]
MITSWEKYSKNVAGKTSSTYNKWIYTNIQQDLQSSGYDRNLEQIRRKIAQLKSRYFKEVRQLNAIESNTKSNWEYFKQLDRILQHQYSIGFGNGNQQQPFPMNNYHLDESQSTTMVSINNSLQSSESTTTTTKRIRIDNDDESNDDNNSIGGQMIMIGDNNNQQTSSSFEDRLMAMIKQQFRTQQQQFKRMTQQIDRNQQSIDLLQQSMNRLQEQFNQHIANVNGQWYSNNGMNVQKNWNYDYNNQYF